MSDDLKPPIEQLLVRMTVREPDTPPCKNHPDRGATAYYKDGTALCAECFALREVKETTEDV
jgi:hypothetical protein